MKLIEKIKNAIFEEEEEFDESFSKESEKKNEPKNDLDDIVKKIDIEKTIPKRIELPIEKEEKEEEIPVREMPKREHRRTPVIFDDEDFAPEKVKPVPAIKPEEVRKPLYGGYRDDKVKEKFKPSPNISPVYGYVGVSPTLEKPRNNEEHLEKHYFVQDKKPSVSLDDVRQKAFGDANEDDDLGLLYEMKNDDKAPAVNKITLGDAEEYFDDLGLEYNVDYKDEAKDKELKDKITSRSTKNKELSLEIEEEIKKEKKLETTRELEITKEQIKPKTAKEIKKVKKIDDAKLSASKEEKQEEDSSEVDEKNLYDLIDMMYDSK